MFTKKIIKFLGKYVEFNPHLRSLDGANAQNAIVLTKLASSDLKNAPCDIMKALEKNPAKENSYNYLYKDIIGIR